LRLWLALCLAADEGTDVAELLRLIGMSRPTLHRRLAEHAKAGRAVQVSRGTLARSHCRGGHHGPAAPRDHYPRSSCAGTGCAAS
jgi:hypothetical protein